MKRVCFIILAILCTIFIVLAGVLAYIAIYRNPSDKKLEDSGVVEKAIQVGDVNYE